MSLVWDVGLAALIKIVGRQSADDGQNKFTQINYCKVSLSYIINRVNLKQLEEIKTEAFCWVLNSTYEFGFQDANLRIMFCTICLYSLKLSAGIGFWSKMQRLHTIDILYKLDSSSLLVKLKPGIFQRLPPFE